MIKELKLSNFRLFDNEVTVRFRPITIFIGKNNAGKSSIIKFLMMLKQSAETSGGGFFITNSNEVELGRLIGLKNKTNKKTNLVFSLRVSEHASPSGKVWEYLQKKKLHSAKNFSTYQAKVSYNTKNQFMGNHKMVFSTKQENSTKTEKNKNTEQEITKREEKISSNSSCLQFQNKKADASSEMEILYAVQGFCQENLQHDLVELKHLSAIREELKGEIRAGSSSSSKYVGKRGKDTVFELWQEIFQNETKKNFLIKHTKQVLGIDDITFKESDELVACNATNTETGIQTNISDFGFGVSQCLPVFVQGLLMPRNTHLIVEQPEAQVHPTAQIEMGSFFVELWKEHGVGSIIETHSDNLLLRIRNHIARKDISQDDVSIAFFTMEGKTPIVKNLDVYDNGTMQEGLPMEFFGGNLVEILEQTDYETDRTKPNE